MKKIAFKFLLSVFFLFVCWLFLQKDFQAFCKKEFSFSFISKLFYGNLYDKSVSNGYTIDVVDYKMSDDSVTVWLPSNTLYLPFSGICTQKTKNSLVVEVDGAILQIINIEKAHLNIYQSFYPNMPIATINDSVTFISSDPDLLVSKFFIIHDKA